MEESVLLGTKPLVDSIHHFIRDPSGVFSVCHLCECRIVQWRHDSRLLLLLNWFLHIIKRTLHISWQEQYLTRSLRSLVRYCSCHSNIKFISSRHRVISSIYLRIFRHWLLYSAMLWPWSSIWDENFRQHAKRSNTLVATPPVPVLLLSLLSSGNRSPVPTRDSHWICGTKVSYLNWDPYSKTQKTVNAPAKFQFSWNKHLHFRIKLQEVDRLSYNSSDFERN